MTVKSKAFLLNADAIRKIARLYFLRNIGGSAIRLALLGFVLASGFITSGVASAQDRQPYEVNGFRGARFGMTETELRAAINKDFGLKPTDITVTKNAVEGTTVLTAKLAALEPGPGSASVAYILGHTSKKLIQVNIIWGDPNAPVGDPSPMVASGERLSHYFADYSWNKDTTRAGVPVGPNTVVLFAGEDAKTGAVRLILDGVKYQMQRDGKDATSPEPKSPARILLNYIANRDNPDVATIPKGQF